MLRIVILLVLSIVLSACGGTHANTPSAETLGTPTSPAKASCSTPSNWTIEYHRTGGFGGFDQSMTLQSDGNITIQSEHPPVDKQLSIPEDHVTPIANLLAEACPFDVGRAEGVCADCFNYELEIQMDGQSYTVKAQDNTLPEDLQPLIDALNQFLQMATQ